MLAADPDAMRPIQKSPKYQHEVVYLGQMSPTKPDLLMMLHEAKNFDLAIYGLGKSLRLYHYFLELI